MSQREEVITIDAQERVIRGEVEKTNLWHDLKNAYLNKSILKGVIIGVTPRPGSGSVLTVLWEGISIPIREEEMGIQFPVEEDGTQNYLRNRLLLNNMIGAEIDFLVVGIDNTEKVAVGSRAEAMELKRAIHYAPEGNSRAKIVEGKLVEARVMAVFRQSVRIEVFGVETVLRGIYVQNAWANDFTGIFRPGDRIPVRITKIQSLGNHQYQIAATGIMDDIAEAEDQIKQSLRRNSMHIGKVTAIVDGTYYIRLDIGINAVAHSCLTTRKPSAGDQILFRVSQTNGSGACKGNITKVLSSVRG